MINLLIYGRIYVVYSIINMERDTALHKVKQEITQNNF